MPVMGQPSEEGENDTAGLPRHQTFRILRQSGRNATVRVLSGAYRDRRGAVKGEYVKGSVPLMWFGTRYHLALQ